jgi:hypothetical protein
VEMKKEKLWWKVVLESQEVLSPVRNTTYKSLQLFAISSTFAGFFKLLLVF